MQLLPCMQKDFHKSSFCNLQGSLTKQGKKLMLSGGQGQAKTCWYLCHAVVAGGWMVLFISALR